MANSASKRIVSVEPSLIENVTDVLMCSVRRKGEAKFDLNQAVVTAAAVFLPGFFAVKRSKEA